MSNRREIWLLVTPSKASRAHWAIEVPGRDGVHNKHMHVIGSEVLGYRLEFKHNYDPSSTQIKTRRYFLGFATGPIIDYTASPNLTNRSEPLPGDSYEKVAAQIPLPRKIQEEEVWPMDTPSQIVAAWAMRGVQEDSQTWARNFIERLIVDGLLPETSRDTMNKAVSAPTGQQ